MEKRVLKTIKKYGLIFQGDSIVAAVSGGPDSVAMLHLICRLAVNWGVKIHVAHLNHMFRGQQSEEEAGFVAAMAEKMGLSFTGESFDVPSYIKRTGLSPEEGARNVRYRFLQRVAEEVKADSIMTAHHANDQAETVLLHLIRGAGPEGLAAMSPREGKLIRPLLEVTREDIINYCQANSLEYRIDPSNNEDVYMRNKVRLNLIPQLKKFNPKIIDTLAKTADICRNENQLLHEITQEVKGRIGVIRPGDRAIIDLVQLDQLHLAVRRRVLRSIVDELANSHGILSFDHTEEMLNLLPGKEICLPGRLYGRKDNGKLIISSVSVSVRDKPGVLEPIPLEVPGMAKVPQLGILIQAEIKSWPDPDFRKNKTTAAFSLKILQQPLFIRFRREGDRFRPKGLKGTKKLKDFFIDEKIPREQRDLVPLVISGKEIIWVVGFRTGEQTEAASEDRKAVYMTVKKLSGA